MILGFTGNLDAKRRGRLNILEDVEGFGSHSFWKIQSLLSEKKISWAGLLGPFRKRKTLNKKSQIV